MHLKFMQNVSEMYLKFIKNIQKVENLKKWKKKLLKSTSFSCSNVFRSKHNNNGFDASVEVEVWPATVCCWSVVKNDLKSSQLRDGSTLRLVSDSGLQSNTKQHNNKNQSSFFSLDIFGCCFWETHPQATILNKATRLALFTTASSISTEICIEKHFVWFDSTDSIKKRRKNSSLSR